MGNSPQMRVSCRWGSWAGVTDASRQPKAASGGQEPGPWTPGCLDANPGSAIT